MGLVLTANCVIWTLWLWLRKLRHVRTLRAGTFCVWHTHKVARANAHEPVSTFWWDRIPLHFRGYNSPTLVRSYFRESVFCINNLFVSSKSTSPTVWLEKLIERYAAHKKYLFPILPLVLFLFMVLFTNMKVLIPKFCIW